MLNVHNFNSQITAMISKNTLSVRPGVPVCKMVGLLLHKSLYNLSNERVVSGWL
ncbi:MAG: hypothetical protein PHQ11_12970 [Paludibacter sp.]|nr:hypothetical protein [Paludibacter sp.]